MSEAMSEALGAPRRTPVAAWAAVVVANAVLGLAGAVAVVLWLATADGLGQRWGWTHPDPTLFDDGLAPWVLLAVAATAIDVVFFRLVNALLRRVAPVRPPGRRRVVAAVAHVVVAVGLALGYLGGLWN